MFFYIETDRVQDKKTFYLNNDEKGRFMRKHKAFTMIELVFVIIILGILSVVAIPKFMGVSEEAQTQRCKNAIGTMNRTVGLNLWSRSIAEGKGGNVVVDAIEMTKQLPGYNATECGAIVGLVAGDSATGDGTYGSPQWVNDGNMTHAPVWIWVKK